MSWFSKAVNSIEYKVVEIERETKLPPVTADLRESLKTLQYHPGFQYLIHKMKYEKAALAKYLHEGFNLTEKELHHLQAGIHYIGWIEAELGRLAAAPVSVVRSAAQEEREVFDRMRSSIELIGNDPEPQAQ